MVKNHRAVKRLIVAFFFENIYPDISISTKLTIFRENSSCQKMLKLKKNPLNFCIDASLEVDVAKGRRDWAFSERDKVVLERESIRTLCDKLRRERDRAVSDLAEALRDSDDVKKQRNEASKENKDLRYARSQIQHGTTRPNAELCFLFLSQRTSRLA